MPNEYTKDEHQAREYLRLLPRPKKDSSQCDKARRRTDHIQSLLLGKNDRREAHLKRAWKPLEIEFKRLRRRAHCLPRTEKAELFHLSGVAQEYLGYKSQILDHKSCVTKRGKKEKTGRTFCKIRNVELITAQSKMIQARRYFLVAAYLRKSHDERANAEQKALLRINQWTKTFKKAIHCATQNKTCYKRIDQTYALGTYPF
jgi:hypothetical protein